MGVSEQETAAAEPMLAVAVRYWQELGLDLGETALVAGDGFLARMFCLAAVWHGACPVIRLDSSDPDIPGVENWKLPSDDPEASLDRLAGRLADAPAVAAVELTGQAVVADALFEILPVYARLLLAGSAGEPLTIDYYNNIHRKGINVLARTIDPAFPAGSGDDPFVARVKALLACPERVKAVMVATRGS